MFLFNCFNRMMTIILLLLTFFSESYADVEREPNNSREAANYVISGTPITGQMMSTSDEDWFYITTIGSDTINIKFEHPYVGYQFNLFFINVYNSQNILLSSVDSYAADQLTVFDVGVTESGSYYVVITACQSGDQCDYHRSDQYKLSITATNVSPGCTAAGCTQSELDAAYAKGYADGSNGMYTQDDMDKMVKSILTWGDTNGDGKIGLQEAVNALQVSSGVRK